MPLPRGKFIYLIYYVCVRRAKQLMNKIVIRSRRVVLPDGIEAASVHLDGEKIARMGRWDDISGELVDAGELVVMPGNVDAHVHVNEPGRTEWEGYETATR